MDRNDEKSEMDAGVHAGHRSRVRERFRSEGSLDSFAPHEVLELLLFYGRSRGDVNPVAHRLLDTFGSLKGVLEARPEQLMNVQGVGEESATLISMILPLFRRYSKCVCQEKEKISTRSEAKQYCTALLSGFRTEHFYIVCLDRYNHLLGSRLVAEGTLSEVAAYPRIAAEAALNYNAASVILCHNHPAGGAEPSADDIRTTKKMQQMFSMLGITLLDHIIVAGNECCSMNQWGNTTGK